MGIGVQRESSGEVAQHAGDSFYVNSILQGNRSEGVAEVVESDLWDSCSGQDSFEHIIDTVRRDGANLGGGGAMGAPPAAGGAT